MTLYKKAKDELKAIHYSVTGTTIKPTDIVSGSFYLRLLREYRAYDRRQKAFMNDQKTVIEEQHETIRECRQEIKRLRTELQRYTDIFNSIITNCRGKDIVSRQRTQIVQLLNQNARLKEELKEALRNHEQK